MSTQLSDDALRLLTDAERAVLEDDYDPSEDDEAAQQALTKNAGGDADDDGDDNQQHDDDAAGTAAGTDDAAAGDAQNAGAATDDQDAGAPASATTASSTPAQPDAAAPVYVAELPQDFADKVNTNKQARKELQKKYHEGDIDNEEFEAEQERLEDERMALLGQQQRAEIAREMNQQASQNAWVSTINAFVKDASSNASLGIVDYTKDKAKQADLDTFVKALANTAGNENKPMRWYLEEAHKRVVALHGIPTAAARAKDSAKRTPNVAAVTANLAEVPGAAGSDAMDDEFSAIDKLTGVDAERALLSLSDEKRRMYLLRG